MAKKLQITLEKQIILHFRHVGRSAPTTTNEIEA